MAVPMQVRAGAPFCSTKRFGIQILIKTFSLGGADYPLSHLEPFDITVAAKDPLTADAVLRVSFSHHVFSVKWDPDVHTKDHEFEADGEQRAFCPVRYGCSIELRGIIEYHIAGKAFKSRDSKGVWRHLFYAEEDGIQYPVIFNLVKADRLAGIDGILHVVSAYQNPDIPARHRLESIKFARLVHQKCPPKAKK
jgi:hypothetical protein